MLTFINSGEKTILGEICAYCLIYENYFNLIYFIGHSHEFFPLRVMHIFCDYYVARPQLDNTCTSAKEAFKEKIRSFNMQNLVFFFGNIYKNTIQLFQI